MDLVWKTVAMGTRSREPRDEKLWVLELCVPLSDLITWNNSTFWVSILVYKVKSIGQVSSKIIFGYKMLWSFEQPLGLKEYSVLDMNMLYCCLDYFWISLLILILSVGNWQEYHISAETNFKPRYMKLRLSAWAWRLSWP